MAARDGVPAWTELVLYAVHGLLHLCGYDDLTEEGAAAMRRREGELLAAEGLSHPFSPGIVGDPKSPPSPLAGEGRVGGGPTEGLGSSYEREASPWPS
jgi:hypothetical protein